MTPFTPVDAHVDAERWLRHSVRVYLEGEKNFPWISRVVRGSEKAAVIVLLTTFGRFNGTPRYSRLLKSLRDSVTNSPAHSVWVMHSSAS
jgi:hypothetical protein